MANLINIGGGAGGSSGGGHTILDNGGTSLTQRTELQFKGAYSEDNSTDEVTEVSVVRSMTKAEFDLLSNDEKVGIINVTDESGSADRNYSETTLWSGSETPSTSGTQITLSDNISNYDEIIIVMDTDYVGTCSFPVSQLTIGEAYIGTIYAPDDFGPYWSYDSDTQVTIKSQSGAHLKTYTKVVGIKYGNGTQTFHNYSTTEQVVGTWIDGKTLYEKTWYFQKNMVSIGTNWTSLNISVSDLNIGEIVDHKAQSYSSQSVSISIWNDGGTLKGIYWQNGLNIGSVTIRYTKSTT